MSKIYEALKKAEKERSVAGDETVLQPSPIEPSPRPSVDGALPPTIAEEYRKMCNAINVRNPNKKVKDIVVTCSVHGEGVSSVSRDFACALIQGGQEKVLLVDANLRNPVLHDAFGLERRGGLVELLSGSASGPEVIKPTNFSGLFVITSGQPAEEPSRLLNSDRLKEALAEWNREYSYVLFDSCPVLNYVDTVILSHLVDGVVLVVQAGKTRWEVVRRAQDTLNNAKAVVLGVVLNRRQYVIPKLIYKRL